MLKKHLVILLLLLAAYCSDTNIPSGTMIEFIREPQQTLILDPSPEFTWIVPHSAKFQTAYQIQVASSLSKLQANEPNMWNSEKIMSSKSVEVEYEGLSLKENSTYFWKVKIWDHQNKESKFSDIQSFRTGIFENYATTKNKFQKRLIKPVSFVKLDTSHYFVDFGKDAFGTLIFSNINVKSIDSLIIHLGEKITSENRIDRDPTGNIRYQEVHLPVNPNQTEYCLKLPADKRNTSGDAVLLPDSMGVIFPFRYCEIENYNQELKPEDIQQKIYHYYFEDNQSIFESSDTILNQVWDISKYSIKATSFTGLYIDGDRERIPYEADAYINQLGHYYTDREYSMGRLTNEYFIDHPTWPTEWILHTVPMFYNDFMFTGNIESIEYYYEELKHKTLISLAGEDGLISSQTLTDEIMTQLGFSDPKRRIRDIVDWPPGQKDTGWKLARPEGERDGYEFTAFNTVVNAFYFQNLKLMTELAGYLGKSSDSIFYLNQAVKVKDSINEKLLDKEKGIYIDGIGSQHSALHANIFPLAFSIVPDEYKSNVIEFIKSRGMACSVYGAQYLLEGLYRVGEAEYATSLLTATHDRSWWNMIKSGSTITMEAWDMEYKPNSDWNHAWGAAPANIIPGYLWGIKPIEPGFKKVEIKPQLGKLQSSKIIVPTIRGSIKAEYLKGDESNVFQIWIPGNMICHFELTQKTFNKMYLNELEIQQGKNRFLLNPGFNKITIR